MTTESSDYFRLTPIKALALIRFLNNNEGLILKLSFKFFIKLVKLSNADHIGLYSANLAFKNFLEKVKQMMVLLPTSNMEALIYLGISAHYSL